MPKFNFKSSITEQDLIKEEAKTDFVSKFFDPGEYDLQIIDAKLNITEKNPTGMSSGDPTWAVFNITFGGIDDRTINSYILVPTVSEVYRKPGMKNPLLMIRMFREFLRGVGLSSEVKDLPKILNGYFKDPSALIGLSSKVVIGHEGPHAKYNKESKTYTVVDMKEEKNLLEGEFADRDSAIAAAAEIALELKPFTKIKKYIAQPVLVAKDDNGEW